jgi:hypothetical protein
MPEQISSSIVRFAVVAAAVLLAGSVEMRTNRAHANDCVAAPSASATQGQHWYYRIERPNHRRCWYLHAILPLQHRPVIKRAEEHHSMSTAASVPMLQRIEESAAGSTHTATLAAKPQLAGFISTAAEEPRRQTVQEETAQEESDPPPIPREAAARQLRSDEHSDVSDDPGDAAANGQSTAAVGIAGALRLILVLLGPALAIAGFLIPVVIKMIGERGIQIPETARIGGRFFNRHADPRAQDQRQDDGRRFGFTHPRSRERFANQEARTRESAREPTRRPRSRSQDTAAAAATAAASAEPPRRDPQGIERALRAIQQARQRQPA